MDNVSFTIEEENLICIYHKHDRRRTIAAISDALPDMDADMRPLAEQTRSRQELCAKLFAGSG